MVTGHLGPCCCTIWSSVDLHGVFGCGTALAGLLLLVAGLAGDLAAAHRPLHRQLGYLAVAAYPADLWCCGAGGQGQLLRAAEDQLCGLHLGLLGCAASSSTSTLLWCWAAHCAAQGLLEQGPQLLNPLSLLLIRLWLQALCFAFPVFHFVRIPVALIFKFWEKSVASIFDLLKSLWLASSEFSAPSLFSQGLTSRNLFWPIAVKFLVTLLWFLVSFAQKVSLDFVQKRLPFESQFGGKVCAIDLENFGDITAKQNENKSQKSFGFSAGAQEKDTQGSIRVRGKYTTGGLLPLRTPSGKSLPQFNQPIPGDIYLTPASDLEGGLFDPTRAITSQVTRSRNTQI